LKIVDLDGNKTEYATGGGTVEVHNNKILVLADSIEKPEEIDIERAKMAYERAKERLSGGRKGDIDVMRAELSLRRAINRMKLTGASY